MSTTSAIIDTCIGPAWPGYETCDFYEHVSEYTCRRLEEDYNFDCSGCTCPKSVALSTGTASTTSRICNVAAPGYSSCDYYVTQYGFDCEALEENYDFDCAGCSCVAAVVTTSTSNDISTEMTTTTTVAVATTTTATTESRTSQSREGSSSSPPSSPTSTTAPTGGGTTNEDEIAACADVAASGVGSDCSEDSCCGGLTWTVEASVDLPSNATWTSLEDVPPVSINDNRTFDTVAYHFQLDEFFVFVSMRAYTDNPSYLGIPVAWNVSHMPISQLRIVSNVQSLARFAGSEHRGTVKFWRFPNCTGSGLAIGDIPEPLCFGTFQVLHEDGTVIFAYNRWDIGGGDVGIGDYVGDAEPTRRRLAEAQRDWSFASNAADYDTRVLSILLDSPGTTTAATAASSTTNAPTTPVASTSVDPDNPSAAGSDDNPSNSACIWSGPWCIWGYVLIAFGLIIVVSLAAVIVVIVVKKKMRKKQKLRHDAQARDFLRSERGWHGEEDADNRGDNDGDYVVPVADSPRAANFPRAHQQVPMQQPREQEEAELRPLPQPQPEHREAMEQQPQQNVGQHQRQQQQQAEAPNRGILGAERARDGDVGAAEPLHGERVPDNGGGGDELGANDGDDVHERIADDGIRDAAPAVEHDPQPAANLDVAYIDEAPIPSPINNGEDVVNAEHADEEVVEAENIAVADGDGDGDDDADRPQAAAVVPPPPPLPAPVGRGRGRDEGVPPKSVRRLPSRRFSHEFRRPAGFTTPSPTRAEPYSSDQMLYPEPEQVPRRDGSRFVSLARAVPSPVDEVWEQPEFDGNDADSASENDGSVEQGEGSDDDDHAI